eukprot:1905307-Pyramimonas_sp.AAC.1
MHREGPFGPSRKPKQLKKEAMLHRGERGLKVHEEGEGVREVDCLSAHSFVHVNDVGQRGPALQKPALVPGIAGTQRGFQHGQGRVGEDPVVGVDHVQRASGTRA